MLLLLSMLQPLLAQQLLSLLPLLLLQQPAMRHSVCISLMHPIARRALLRALPAAQLY